MSWGKRVDNSEKLRVLLIDDDPFTEAILSRMFKGADDFELHYCQYPADAMAMVERIRPMVILLDLVMPELDGWTLLKRFRASRLTRTLPIIILSAEDTPQMKADCIASGASNYLIKLPDRVEMIARLRYHTTHFLKVTRKGFSHDKCEDIHRERSKGFLVLNGEDKTIVQVDAVLADILGRRPEDLVGVSPMELVIPDDLSVIEEALNWMPRPDRRVYEVHLLHRDGENVYTRFCVESREDKTRGYTVATFTFVNPVVWQSRSFMDHSRQFRLHAESIPGMVWMSSGDDARTFFNPGWLTYTGRSHSEEIGGGWLQGVHPDDRDALLSASRKAITTREKIAVEYRLRSNTGEYRWIYDAGMPFYARDGAFLGYAGSCVDITRRRREEERIRNFNAELERRIAARTRALKREVDERRRAEQQARRATQAQSVISGLLGITLDAMPLKEKLELALATILTLSTFSDPRKGRILLWDTTDGLLAHAVHYGFQEWERPVSGFVPESIESIHDGNGMVRLSEMVDIGSGLLSGRGGENDDDDRILSATILVRPLLEGVLQVWVGPDYELQDDDQRSLTAVAAALFH
ncbi:MAG: PAS domain-containing protein [Magnetococcales bacterium]|nr:PAS domain-containing protein [Magnetococcales bacterium]